MTKIVSDNPEEDALKFIKENFSELLPFQVERGMKFQMRFKEDVWKLIPDEYRKILLESCEKETNNSYIHKHGSPEEIQRWEDEHFWTPCKTHVFNYESRNSIIVLGKCEFGYEGIAKCSYHKFMKKGEFPDFVLYNFDTCGKNEPKYVW